jgi:hypothetical protein
VLWSFGSHKEAMHQKALFKGKIGLFSAPNNFIYKIFAPHSLKIVPVEKNSLLVLFFCF